jgi:hypothetical protein
MNEHLADDLRDKGRPQARAVPERCSPACTIARHGAAVGICHAAVARFGPFPVFTIRIAGFGAFFDAPGPHSAGGYGASGRNS